MEHLMTLKLRAVCVVVAVLWAGPLWAQSAPSRVFEWEHPEADITANIVSRFELSIDGGAWVDVGMVAAGSVPGFRLFRAPVPALTPGAHTAVIRACNASMCGDMSETISFVFDVKPGTPVRLRFASTTTPPEGL